MQNWSELILIRRYAPLEKERQCAYMRARARVCVCVCARVSDHPDRARMRTSFSDRSSAL